MLSPDQVHSVKIQEMMILNFIKHITKMKMPWTIAKPYIIDVLIKLLVMWRISSDVAPQDYFAGLLIHAQRLHHHHDILHIVRKLFDDKLIIVFQFIFLTGYHMQFKTIDVDV